ncbi:MAG: MAE_28990/MAE_18760 family HEPN-like nuclease [Limnospira sp. PMC 1291.21]|uniref:MAE_28990/MAE_18760 family HEPN-like nuclease n=1 Tax=Limnospira TaxID=2596745 RepID=UPI00061AC3A2|nr:MULTISPECIES: MAE_28990/MAE_18760 family HEPN-like nuclease [Limnospira]MDT9180481.1 MAE_28990/MAE_18760 family HEPN-like nuclease [Limnospira sp. PMC 1238.20]MDT9195779.1 MAE_28990/MAE_18760 family HEPN-like nuclease [Limnospira sp. PMC 1245.20]MDT9205400.1 MAE_28990/MAE_18760 family HEPN-like nuclease [Limnospira sp. PMC 1243.20]MDT9211188.1 MAE_28990/MAE_18760 family HEPN-like nuclease [Limnospira sp. PMC 1252.20]MDT9216269.1 MAE_28990/MAE_18760 family HEPN-like nuclease [Limnospira sp. 
MDSTLWAYFNKQSVEVSQYFMFLKRLEQKTTMIDNYKLCIGDINASTMIHKYEQIYFNTDIEKTLKANGFLLLYNLVEGTMRRAIEYIFDYLDTHQVNFDVLRREMKIVILKNIQKRSPAKIIDKIDKISLDIIIETWNNDDVFSGNIDAKKIKDVAQTYGFSSKVSPRRTQNSEDLLSIKNHRNDLAHGLKSFNDIGRDTTAKELFIIKNRVIIYLRQIIINIENYLANQEYLKTP